MPSSIAEKTQRLRHIGSMVRSIIGRYIERRTVLGSDLSNFSIGAFHLSSPVSFLFLTALRFNSLWSMSVRGGPSLNIEQEIMHSHWMVCFGDKKEN